ncbi:unnamed protein product, partial [Didymodactylos carnosus]
MFDVHGLIISDLNPRDRQNLQSCLKITSEEVLQILRDNSDIQATYVYLQLLKYIIESYILVNVDKWATFGKNRLLRDHSSAELWLTSEEIWT